jgi:hypothetical protein
MKPIAEIAAAHRRAVQTGLTSAAALQGALDGEAEELDRVANGLFWRRHSTAKRACS